MMWLKSRRYKSCALDLGRVSVRYTKCTASHTSHASSGQAGRVAPLFLVRVSWLVRPATSYRATCCPPKPLASLHSVFAETLARNRNSPSGMLEAMVWQAATKAGLGSGVCAGINGHTMCLSMSSWEGGMNFAHVNRS